MKRQIVLALAALFVCPALALSQEASVPARRITVTPFLGYAFSYTQKGAARLTLTTPTSEQSSSGNYVRQVEGGVMPGVMVEYDLPGRFGASAAVAYNQRGDESVSLDYVDTAPMYSPGAALWFVRAAATMDLLQSDPDLQIHRPLAHLSAGPMFVHEAPDGSTGRYSTNAAGLYMAAEVEMPLPWAGFSVRGAVEDYMSHIGNGEVAVSLGSDLSTQTGYPTLAEMSHGLTNMYAVRAGLSYRFQF